MQLPLFLAKKFIRSKKEAGFLSLISVISIIGIALGVAVLIIALTILDGYEEVIGNKIVNFNSHIKITGFSERNLPSYEKGIPDIKEKIGDQIVSISPFVAKLSIIKSKTLSEGVLLTGIMPDSNNADIQKYINKGKFDIEKKEGLNSIILGKKLADKLFIDVGDKVTVFSLRNDRPPSINNPPAIEQFRVTGIYESGMAEYDDLNAYVNMAVEQNLLDLGKQVTGYNIRLKNVSKADSIKQALQDHLRYPYYVRTIFDVHRNIFTWIDLQKKPIPIVLGLIVLVAVFNIIGTLLMMIIERTSLIGTLKALGAQHKQIVRTFIIQGIYLSIIGIAIGNIIAISFSLLQKHFQLISLPSNIYFINSVPISIEAFNYILVSGVALILSFAASYIPSRIAAKINPVTALRFD
jgi:lipoprotein-releasing system permease protein